MTTIDVTLDPPNPLTDSQATFNSKSLAFTQALTPWAAQVNTVAGEVNTAASNAAASASAASGYVTDSAAQKTLAQGYATDAANQAALAAASAASAVNAPGTSATSTTSRTIVSGSVTVTIQAGKAFVVGQFVVLASTASPANYIAGQITAHNSVTGSITIDATHANGTGTFADWSISVIGSPGAGGATGDILFSANELEAPAYLPCDGSLYLKSTYPTLSTKLGTIGLFEDPIPVSLPTGLTASGSIFGADWSPDGQYLIVAANSTPLRAMKRSGETLTNLTISGQTGSAYEAVFDGVDGTYLGEVGSGSPYVRFHKRTGDTFSLLSNPVSLPPGGCIAIDCSADGVYWAVLSTASPYLVLYKRSGDTFTKLAGPATIPGGSGLALSFSSDGQYLAVTTRSTSPYIRLYQRSGDTFIAIPFPGVIPPGSDIVQVKFDPSGRYLAVRSNFVSTHTTFVYDIVDSWSMRTLSIFDGGIVNVGSYMRFSWSSNGEMLSVPTYYGPALFDARNNFARIPGPVQSASPAGSNAASSISPDNLFLLWLGSSGAAQGWKRRYDPTSLFSTPRIIGAKAYIKA